MIFFLGFIGITFGSVLLVGVTFILKEILAKQILNAKELSFKRRKLEVPFNESKCVFSVANRNFDKLRSWICTNKMHQSSG